MVDLSASVEAVPSWKELYYLRVGACGVVDHRDHPWADLEAQAGRWLGVSLLDSVWVGELPQLSFG